MTIRDLQQRLTDERIYESIYSLRDESEHDDCHVITQESDGWHVFYKEREKRVLEVVFSDENSA